ncbi:metal-dependent transcriptional regulator [Geoalkalibacter halelectricus]|uniref:Metal-dependent transcriptional regulator n=1 Tax=Geoalkalibacter halelectricus TaxID=2847045 RepID=A0ABY5ZHM0_9BACT|nr:metal-dependent transcriptional regulator [Geoalkalibacter halelectricus]MDO3379611.1 metal-dependent transcriptional regulator [Geoalkalibacter halelectricus]UWZ78573.1 metal-dependent transcriptional regulator [Geoalkalibacter halelectricus]
MKVSPKAEEILEALWIATEEAGDNAAHLSTLGIGPDDEALAELNRLAYIEVSGDRVYLRKEGRPEARMTVRRHRLAERLMMDILDVKGGEGNAKACELEHLLHQGVDTKICTLLNHPSTCPHGNPIPPGLCCEEAREQGRVGVVALTELKAGEGGEIAYLAADDPKKMQKLMSMGVLPGNRLQLSQTFPTFVFKVGHSQFAVDQDLAREIFVRKE